MARVWLKMEFKIQPSEEEEWWSDWPENKMGKSRRSNFGNIEVEIILWGWASIFINKS